MKKRNNYQKNQKNNAVRNNVHKAVSRPHNNVDIKEVSSSRVDSKFQDLVRSNVFNDDMLFYLPVFKHEILVINTDKLDSDFIEKCKQNFECVLVDNELYHAFVFDMTIFEIMHYLQNEAFVVADLTTDFECHKVL